MSAIQYLRAVAAILVVFYHGQSQFSEVEKVFSNKIGASGVDMFFVISGFVMTYTSVKQRYTAKEFLTRRAVRIVPLYWSMTIAVAIMLLVASHLTRDSKFTIQDLVLSLLFIPHENPGLPGSLSPMLKLGWTLNYEVFFYLVFAGLIALPGTRRTLLLGTLFLAYVWVASVVHPTLAPIRFWGDLLLLEFILGCVVAHIYMAEKLRRMPRIGFMVLLIGGGAALVYFGGEEPTWHRFFFFGLPSACVVLGCVGLESTSSKGWRSAVWLYFGDASYSIYLTHLYVVIAFRLIWERGGLPKDGLVVATLFVSLCVVFGTVAGCFTFSFFERPLTVWVRKKVLLR